MNLYLITIKSLDSFYVIAENIDLAYEKLLKCFEKEDLYFPRKRELKSVEVIGKYYYQKDIWKEND